MTNTVNITIDREVAERWEDKVSATPLSQEARDRRAITDACREALTNPPTPGLREAAQKFVDRWAHPDKLTADQLHRLVDSLEAALSQTPEADEKEVQDPPPTAPGTASEEVSESVDCSRGGDGLCECGGGRFIDRLMSHSDGNVWIRLEGENLAQIESLRGDVVSLEVHRAPLGEGEPWCATNPSPPEEGDDWQPIETAPEEREVLVRLANGQITNAKQLRGFPNNDETYWRTMTGMVLSPHHWMPLPTPPTEGGES